MDQQLWIADGFHLPPEAVTETFAILAKRGAGKSYTASVMVEEMVSANLPVCVIDPTGAWWGLRSDADGLGPGLPVFVFGGEHGDLPLTHDQGALVAAVVIDERIPVVLDLSLMSKTQQRRFVTDFMEYLYHHNRDPLHLVVDEADLYAPQTGRADTARMLGAYEDVVRRGRKKGLGCTSITQRPASLHKDILSQSEVLIVLRMNGVRDVNAINEWVQNNADVEQARELKASLASLPIGTAWIWSPGWLDVLQKIQIRKRLTFDSGATPKPGQKVVQPRDRAVVDLERLRDRLAPPDVPAAGEPTSEVALRLQVDQLRRDLTAALDAPPAVVHVPTVDPAVLSQLAKLTADLSDLVTSIQPAAGPAVPKLAARMPSSGRSAASPIPAISGLRAGARRIVTVVARHHPMQITKAQVATLAGLKASGGTFGTYFSDVRRGGFIVEQDGLIGATPAGLAVAGVEASTGPMTTGELRDQWMKVLRAGARTMLTALLDEYPGAMTRDELATAAGLERGGGTFGTYLSNLRNNGLAVVKGPAIRAADVFFLNPGETR